MKDNMVENVFRRIEAYNSEKKTGHAIWTKIIAFTASAGVIAAIGIGLWNSGLLNPRNNRQEGITSDDSSQTDSLMVTNFVVLESSEESIIAYPTGNEQIGGVTVPAGIRTVIRADRFSSEIPRGSVVSAEMTNPIVDTSCDPVVITCDLLSVNAYVFKNESFNHYDYPLTYPETLIIGNSVLNYNEDGNYTLYGVESTQMIPKQAEELQGTFTIDNQEFEFFAAVTDKNEFVNMPDVMKKEQLLTSAQVVGSNGDRLLIEITFPHASDRTVNKGLVLFSTDTGTATPVIDHHLLDDLDKTALIHDIKISKDGLYCLVESIGENGTGSTFFSVYDASEKTIRSLDSRTSLAWFSEDSEILAVEENEDATINLVIYTRLLEKRCLAESVTFYTPGTGGFILPKTQNGDCPPYCMFVGENGKMSFLDYATGETTCINEYYYPINAEVIQGNDGKTVFLCQIPAVDGIKCLCSFDYAEKTFSVCEFGDELADFSKYYMIDDVLLKIRPGGVTVIR